MARKETEEMIAEFAAKGWIYDSGRRRKGKIVWVATPGKEEAEARAALGLSPPPSYANLPSAPDLQAFVARYGGFSKVPVEAWRNFDRRVAKYKVALRRNQSAYRRKQGG